MYYPYRIYKVNYYNLLRIMKKIYKNVCDIKKSEFTEHMKKLSNRFIIVNKCQKLLDIICN